MSDALVPVPEGPLAIVAGTGVLPKLLAEAEAVAGRPYRVVHFQGVPVDWLDGQPVVPVEFEKPGRLFRSLRQAGITRVSFAGGMTRPKLRPMQFDLKGLMLAPRLFRALKAGDDETLRIIRTIFEAEGFGVVAPQALLASLLAEPGVLGVVEPGAEDRADAVRAAEIVAAIGAADVGQASVVAQGICLGVESIQGTDAMLKFVAETGAPFRPDSDGARGVLFKGPKPGQDWSIDLPAIGPETLRQAAAAGLAGVVVEAGGVLILGREETVAEADRLGLFLWSRAPDAA